MIRELTAVAQQSAAGASFAVTVQGPAANFRWTVNAIQLEVPGYTAGALRCDVSKNGRFLFGTSQGQNDTAGGAPVRVHAGEALTFTWYPTRVPGVQQGIVTLQIDEVPV